MVTTTRTLNPLPFRDLDPNRFEDLVRQLVYDFRAWRSLEATGRSGSDQGFDIRGFELVPNLRPAEEDEQPDEVTDDPSRDRVWLIQCKREKQIGPKKIAKIFDDTPDESLDGLYGLVFVASCSLSKATRDVLRERCRERGISECHIWSGSEIEDQLFQPRNDNLLFAYFGISLKHRQRSLKTGLRSRLAAKRKAYRCLGGHQDFGHNRVLLIDPEEDRYPYLDGESHRLEHAWRIVEFVEQHPWGVVFRVAKHYAFFSTDEKSWDAAQSLNTVVGSYFDPWSNQDGDRFSDEELEIREIWHDDIPETERATLSINFLIPYEEILDIDKDGDKCFDGPHVYLPFEDGFLICENVSREIRVNEVTEKAEHGLNVVAQARSVHLNSRDFTRVERFPEKYRHARRPRRKPEG